MKKLFLLLTVLVLAAPGGCSYEQRGVTMRTPGVYKGARDPLLDKHLEQELTARLQLVQTDR